MSVLASINLGWGWANQLTDDSKDKIKLKFPRLTKKDDGELTEYAMELIVDEDELRLLVDCGVEPTIKRFKGLIPNKIASDVENVNDVHLHLPNYVLTNFNKVKVVEDYCTEQLQMELDDGWRIIAICPPLNARRPDYILAKVEN